MSVTLTKETNSLAKNDIGLVSAGENLPRNSPETSKPIDTNLIHQANTQDQSPPISPQPPNKTWENFRKLFTDKGPAGFKFFRNYFTLGLNSVGITLNVLAFITSNSSLVSKDLTKKFDKYSEWFSRNVIPLSFGWNGVEALVGNRALEAAARIIPAISFFFLPFYNLNIATGVSSGLQYLFELVRDRHGGKNPATHSIKENAKQTIQTSLAILKDIFTFNQKHESLSKQISTLALLTGGFGGLLFASQERDSLNARIFGNTRNGGGLIADWLLIFNNIKDNLRRAFDLRLVGSLCSTASILNILIRWINNDFARSCNHLAFGLDNLGLTYWAQCSKRDNDEQFADKKLEPAMS
jgi:hypothetical protein